MVSLTFSSRLADLVRSLSAPLMRRPKSARTIFSFVCGVECASTLVIDSGAVRL